MSKQTEYQAAYYKKNKKRIKARNATHYKKHRKEKLAANAAWRKRNKRKIKVIQAAWQEANKETIRMKKNIYDRNRVIHKTIYGHHYLIFRSTKRKNYKGMPFFDEWNPDKGGSFDIAERWILENLGKRPKGTTLHIIQHDLGFVPGNLEWTFPRRQSNQLMFKIIAQQRHRIKELEKRIKELEIR